MNLFKQWIPLKDKVKFSESWIKLTKLICIALASVYGASELEMCQVFLLGSKLRMCGSLLGPDLMCVRTSIHYKQ